VQTLDQACDGFPIAQASVNQTIQAFMSNSFGFGGTNASLVFKQAEA
jgi:3-oxoacyl-[acyl-carrier-protein] synthase-1